MNQAGSSDRADSLLQRLALHRPELRAWALYDWAASAAQTTIMVAVFPLFYTAVAGAGFEEGLPRRYWAISNGVSIAIIAIIAPLLGAVADYSAAKKKFLALFMTIGVLACAGMFLLQHGQLLQATILFILVTVGASGSFVFYEALLPHITSGREMDRLSTAGYAVGYIGGGVLLALNLLCILNPGLFGLPTGEGLTPSQATLPTRLTFLSVAVWWLLFSLPLFRRVPEPPVIREADESTARGQAVRAALTRLGETLRELRGYKQAFLLLVAYLIYNDGIGTIQRMAAVYGESLGIERNVLITAILIVQFVGIPFSFMFGALAVRIGTKRAIFAGLAVYTGISVFGYFMQSATHFFVLAFLVGMVQGGTQALTRSLFASMIPSYKSGEFFGFFSVFSKFAGIFGPLLFAWVDSVTGSMRYAILSTILFFIAGTILLTFVNVEEGVEAAAQAEANARAIITS